MSVVFIDTHYENASPVSCRHIDEHSVHLQLSADHERHSSNKQSTHWNFKIQVPDDLLGTTLQIIVRIPDGIWNQHPPAKVHFHNLCCKVRHLDTDLETGLESEWFNIDCDDPDDPLDTFCLSVPLNSRQIQVVHLVPYNLSELADLLHDITQNEHVRSYEIGKTVNGLPLEMIECGSEHAEFRVLLRARSHPWEAGGSWVLDGLLRYLNQTHNAEVTKILQHLCFYIMPMCNKDGVVSGMTRYNTCGIDLNRNWIKGQEFDPQLAPENVALISWLNKQKEHGRLPHLAMCLHNDEEGHLHLSKPKNNADSYMKKMHCFEDALRKYTWFREGPQVAEFKNQGSFGEGLMEIYEVDALILELNAHWSIGLNRSPESKDWQEFGSGLCHALMTYFNNITITSND